MYVDALQSVVWRWAAWALFLIIVCGHPVELRADGLEMEFGRRTPGSTLTVDHSALARVLQRYASQDRDGVVRVDYAALKRSGRTELQAYISQLTAVDVAKLDRPEQFAFWANLYNAKTLDVVSKSYPVASIKDISLGGGFFAVLRGGPWKAKVVTVGRVSLSLDDIEHGIMRPIFGDMRVHYAVNCASLGCPNLPLEPFTGSQLETQLDAAARAYINHPRGVTIDGDVLTISSIYEWYRQDFGNSDAGILAHLKQFAAAPLRKKLDAVSGIASYRYDWALNDTAKQP